jgi:hypothetical protein
MGRAIRRECRRGEDRYRRLFAGKEVEAILRARKKPPSDVRDARSMAATVIEGDIFCQDTRVPTSLLSSESLRWEELAKKVVVLDKNPACPPIAFPKNNRECPNPVLGCFHGGVLYFCISSRCPLFFHLYWTRLCRVSRIVAATRLLQSREEMGSPLYQEDCDECSTHCSGNTAPFHRSWGSNLGPHSDFDPQPL